MFQKQEHNNITPFHDRHIHDFCDYAVLELKGKYIHHWRMNLIFTAYYLGGNLRIPIPAFDNFSTAIQKMSYIPDSSVLTDTFRLLLSKADEALIISKAAMYCLEYLCDRSRTRKDTKRHIQIPKMHRNYRKTRPWRWHQRHPDLCRDLTRTPVFLTNRFPSSRSQRLSLTTYGRLFAELFFEHDPIYTVHSRRWIHWRSDFYNSNYTAKAFFKYLALMEYLITILLRVGRFPPLIHLCRTRSFSPMSMMFPDLSLQARRAIGAYLDRMDSPVDSN